MSTMKLQKLVYYAQAWHLVWDEEPLFGERIEAWAGGPVVRELYNAHRGYYRVSTLTRGNSSNLTESQRESVRVVMDSYGSLTGQQLSYLTHRERPWLDARRGLSAGDRGSSPIPLESLADYYGSLDSDPDALSISDVREMIPGILSRPVSR